ncbi:MAG: MBL fold metallo-hydrolase [Candidatus Bathyarchaeota archaeon]|nr:MAG: MBL fold metallo-hydrolase [Candidatus Bathyarchaeota archaeon]
MYSERLSKGLYMIDLNPAGFDSLVASYVLRASKVAIIESGPLASVENLLTGLEEIGVGNEEVNYLAVSHVHVDHAGGAGALLRHLPNAKLLVHPRGAPHIVNPRKLWAQTKQALGRIAEMYGEVQPVPEERIITATNEMNIDLGEGVELEVLDTPGHASHALSFHEKATKGIFTGDAAGIYLNEFDVLMPTTPAPFHLEKTLTSLRLLLKMAPQKLYYSHFGATYDAIKKLRACVAQLKLWSETILGGMRDNEDFAGIYGRLLEKDVSMKQVADFVDKHVVLNDMIRRDVQGFIEYFKRYAFGNQYVRT